MGSLEYNIAGPADDEDYAQAEYLAEMLMVSLPTITCNLVPVMPDDWGAFAKQKCAFLGCRERAPLIWLNSGAVVGGLKEFSKECAEKYGVEIKGVDYSTWPKVAKENFAAAKKAAAGTAEPPVGAVGSGEERGAAICEALMFGNARYLGTPLAPLTTNVEGSAAHSRLTEPAATVLALTPLPAAAHALLGCEESNLFVLPCTPAGIEELVVGNAEFGAIAHKTTAILLVAAPTAELATYVQAAKDAVAAKDAPVALAHAAAVEAMMPALSRTLAAAPPKCSKAQVEALCLEEWLRTCSDELLRQSAVLAELSARGELLVQRAVCDAAGALTVV